MDRRPPENEESRAGILAGNHLAEDVLEQYSIGKLSVEDVTAVEDHIFECAHCQQRFERMDAYVQATRTAARAIPPDFKRSNPKLMMPIAIAAAIATVFFIPKVLVKDSSPLEVNLASVRNEVSAKAPVDRKLRLVLDLTGLNPEPLKFEVATVSGTTVSSGELKQNEAKLQLEPLAAGQYWVRLKSADGNQTLREFSLLVQ